MSNATNNYQKDLVHNLAEIQNDKNMRDFLEVLLTSDEREEMAKRLQIFKRLLKGQAQRKVAEELGVGIATVTRGAAELRNKEGKVEKMIKY